LALLVEGLGSVSFEEVCRRFGVEPGFPVVAWRVNGVLRPLSWVVDEGSTVELVDTTSFEGVSVYRNSLIFLLARACRDLFGRELRVLHSISDGYYCEVEGLELAPQQVELVRSKALELVDRSLPFKRYLMPRDRAMRVFSAQGFHDKEALVRWVGLDPVEVYELEGFYGTFLSPLVPDTSFLRVFELRPFEAGFVVQFPTVSSPLGLPPFRPALRLSSVFREYARWLSILGLEDVSSLHEMVSSGRALELVLVSEALHSRRFFEIACEVRDREARLVCVAGPSAAGKTTTAHRLSVWLRLLGLKPYVISLDDYFVDRERTPRDEKGDYDFEALEALDLPFLEEQLKALLAGDEVVLPRYNFHTGRRERGRPLRLEGGAVLVLEGIHGLNEAVSHFVPRAQKVKVFVSPLTALSLDRHNRISTGDTRLLRRLVRDHRTRGRSAESTLSRWPSVVRGASRYIFPYQEEADVMFNSALVYEISVLKAYAEPLLRSIPDTSPQYGEARRLLSVLSYLPSIPPEVVPTDSVLREFIGGGLFEVV